MEIKNYNEINVKLIRSTDNPLELISKVAKVTMSRDFEAAEEWEKIPKILLKMNHTSPLEFIDYTFLVTGASRSFLAQMTRHRMASYCSSSQHYQEYSKFPFTIDYDLTDEQQKLFEKYSIQNIEAYKDLMDKGVPKYEARQILANAASINLYIKMNARSLINFLNLRLCFRNTNEIQAVAEKMLFLCRKHFPELFDYVGADCFMKGKCSQGKMMPKKCKEGYTWEFYRRGGNING